MSKAQKFRRLLTSRGTEFAMEGLERFGAVPPELADLVARCLAKNPSDRPAVATLVQELRNMLGEPERLHFDGTRSTLRPPDSPVVSISGDANPTAPTLLLDSDDNPQAEVGTAETMLDPGSQPGLASSPSVGREGGGADTRTSPSAPPDRTTEDEPGGSVRTVAVAAVALLVGGAAVWMMTPRPDSSGPVPSVAAVEEPAATIEPAPTLEPVPTPEPVPTLEPVPPREAVPPPEAITGDSSEAKDEPPAVAAAPRAPAKPVLPPFDEAAAQTALERKAKSASLGCRFHDGPRVFAVEVTFRNDGRASRARHNMRLTEAGASGRCVLGMMHGATVPPFRGDPTTRTIGVALKPRM